MPSGHTWSIGPIQCAPSSVIFQTKINLWLSPCSSIRVHSLCRKMVSSIWSAALISVLLFLPSYFGLEPIAEKPDASIRGRTTRTFWLLGRSGFSSTIESNLPQLYLNMNIAVSNLSLLFEYEHCSCIILLPSIGILFCADDAKPQGNKAKSRMHFAPALSGFRLSPLK